MVHDPQIIGVLTGRAKEESPVRVQVDYLSHKRWVPLDQLEPVPDEPEGPLELAEYGKYGGPGDLRRALTHIRLAGRLADVIYSMNVTGTDFYAYQFKPVLKLLNSPVNGLLVADEVGLGKTIEAGLIWTELRARFQSNRILVLCPAMLREKWQYELSRRFGVRADILDARNTLTRLESAANDPLFSFAIVASLQGLRPPRRWEAEAGDGADPRSRLAQFLQDREHDDPIVDLLVIDEAHYLRNPGTQTARLGQLARAASDHVVLLSATPIHLRSDDLFHLLRLVDEDTFQRREDFGEVLTANEPLNRARDLVLRSKPRPQELLRELEAAKRYPLLQGSQRLQALLDELGSRSDLTSTEDAARIAHRIEALNLLGDVLTRTRKRDVQEWRVVRRAVAQRVPLTAEERRFYEAVTEIVRDYCRRAEAHEGFLLVGPQRQVSSSMPAALRSWREIHDQHEGLFDEEIFEDFGASIEEKHMGPLVSTLARRSAELGDFERLKSLDSKYRILTEALRELWASRPDEKVIIFSFFRATLRYLDERLAADGVRAEILVGGMSDKERVLERFRDPAGAHVLLSSEVGSEGIDLQFSSTVVNYDLPWNPMKVEQRIGRVDRLGQVSDVVSIWNLFYEDTIDSRIYDRLLMRLGIFKRALGGMEAVLGEMTQKLALELLSKTLTPAEEEERIEATAQALANIQKEEERLEDEAAGLVAFSDYILNQIRAARELSRQISAEDLYYYVRDFLDSEYRGHSLNPTGDRELEYVISLPTEARHQLEQFLQDKQLQAGTRLHGVGVGELRCRFENTALPARRGEGEIVSQFHPLVRFVSKKLRSRSSTRPAVAARVDTGELSSEIDPGVYVFLVQLWTVKGLQDVESLWYSAVASSDPRSLLKPAVAEDLVLATSTAGVAWPGARTAVSLELVAEALRNCEEAAASAYDERVTDARRQNEDRADLQRRTLERHFQNQSAKLARILARFESERNEKLIPATKGRIRKLQERFDRDLLKIEDRRTHFGHSAEDVAAGLILVEGAP